MCIYCHRKHSDEKVLRDIEDEIANFKLSHWNSLTIDHLLLAYSGVNDMQVRNAADRLLQILCSNIDEDMAQLLRDMMTDIDTKFYRMSISEIKQAIYGSDTIEHGNDPHSDGEHIRDNVWHDTVYSGDREEQIFQYFDIKEFRGSGYGNRLKKYLPVLFLLGFVYIVGRSLGYIINY